MDHKELIEKLNTVINNLNDEGLMLINYLVGDMHKVEKYNITTSSERISEIKAEEAERRAEKKEAKEKAMYKRMREEVKERKNKIASLEGREKVFWRKIERIQKMDISRYNMKTSDVYFMAELYKNNLINASQSIFYFGFYQGMRYLKNQARKSK